jgi:hypothetical protein
MSSPFSVFGMIPLPGCDTGGERRQAFKNWLWTQAVRRN